MVSDQDIAKGVETLLRQSDPNAVTSVNDVVSQLETRLGLDLSHKAGFIREQINLLLRAHPTTQSQPQQPPPPPAPPKDQYALHHPSPFPHFALQPHSHPQELSFRQPQPLQPVAQPPHPHVSVPNSSSVVSPKDSATVGSKRRGGPGGLNKVCGVSPELQAIVGEPALPRTEIVKQLWAYIRKNNLQDPSNKRKIICDDALRVVFETDCTDMFKMNKLLAKHILPLDPSKESGQAKRVKVDVEPTTVETAEHLSSSTVMISEALAKFFGTDEREMLESEAMNRVWEYIKLHHLEDPSNPMAIVCDSKLGELLGCESISAVGVNEMLRRHLLKRS